VLAAGGGTAVAGAVSAGADDRFDRVESRLGFFARGGRVGAGARSACGAGVEARGGTDGSGATPRRVSVGAEREGSGRTSGMSVLPATTTGAVPRPSRPRNASLRNPVTTTITQATSSTTNASSGRRCSLLTVPTPLPDP